MFSGIMLITPFYIRYYQMNLILIHHNCNEAVSSAIGTSRIFRIRINISNYFCIFKSFRICPFITCFNAQLYFHPKDVFPFLRQNSFFLLSIWTKQLILVSLYSLRILLPCSVLLLYEYSSYSCNEC